MAERSEGVYIHEAVRAATLTNKHIARVDMLALGMKIRPTDTFDCCIISESNKSPAPRWEPKAEDLTADDWCVVD